MSYGGRQNSLGARSAAPRQQQRVYSFPLLKGSEILQCMHELQISLTEEELRSADKDAVRRVYETLVELCTGTTREEMQQPVFSGLNALDYPELHEESIPELTFFRAVAKMMTVCGVSDFSLKDFTHPEPKRLRRHLSAVINFAKFREERVIMFQELTANTDNLLETRQKLEDEQAELNRQLEQLKAKRAAEEPALNKIREECAELETEINKHNRRQAVLRHETNELKTKANDLRDGISNTQYTNLSLQEQITTLKGQIVTSPARFKKEVEDMAESLEDEKAKCNETERRAVELQAFLETIGRAEKDVKKVLTFLEELEEETKRYKEAKAVVKGKRSEINASLNMAAEAEAQKQRLTKQLRQKMENLNNLRRQADLKSEAAEQALSAAKQEMESVEQERKQGEQLIKESSEALEILEAKRSEEETNAKADIEEMTETYKRLEKVVSSYHEKLIGSLSSCHVTSH